MKRNVLKFKQQPELVRLDLGAGKGANTPEGFEKIDIVPGSDITVVDLTKRWPWKSNSVDEAQSNYLLQYLTPDERIHWANELYRVLKPGCRCVIFTPHWSAGKAYGDIRVQWPPVGEAWYQFLNKEFRDAQNCVIDGYTCDFECTFGYGLHPAISTRNQEYQQHAATFFKEAIQELVCTITARK
jgi:hypothetical protein